VLVERTAARPFRPMLWVLLAGAAATVALASSPLPVTEVRLENGFTLLLVPRPHATMVSAGWAARVGSADEAPGQTGRSHLVEHMLFKGSRTVGTRDPAAESALLREQDEIWEEIRELEKRPGSRAQRRLAELTQRFRALLEKTRALAFLGEFSFLYSEAGGDGLNARTLHDLTFYWATLPAEKLELWFWLESDRLLHPVFREFYKEKAVIAEERRQRVESQPTGEVDAELRADLWKGTPYAWPPLGHRADLERVTRAEPEAFFQSRDPADRLTALDRGDTVEFYGEYEWTSAGGVIHWTHRDPARRHVAGWLKHEGKRVQ